MKYETVIQFEFDGQALSDFSDFKHYKVITLALILKSKSNFLYKLFEFKIIHQT